MGFGSKPKTPEPTPAPPTIEDATTDDDLEGRRKARKRAMGAVNSATSNLSGSTILGSKEQSRQKTLLGQ